MKEKVRNEKEKRESKQIKLTFKSPFYKINEKIFYFKKQKVTHIKIILISINYIFY